jgi:hypothetical protein
MIKYQSILIKNVLLKLLVCWLILNVIFDLDRIFFVSELTEFLSKVIDLRNDHAHIKAMSLEKYNELFDLLFDSSEIEKTNLFKLLEFKKSIKNFISN